MVLRRPRPLWRTLVDAIVFLSVLFIVLLLLNRFGLLDERPMELGPGAYAVIDGDSLRNSATEIRLVGIDAPEYRQTCLDLAGQTYACGKQAAAELRSLVSKGQVQCKSHETDRYHRALSTCTVGGIDINRQMVRQGWAIAYGFHGSEFDYAFEESDARRAKRGLWQGNFEKPSDYRKRQRVIEGNASGVSAPDD